MKTIALIYDFDGTLSPGNMQDFGFIQTVGKDIDEFWAKCTTTAFDNDASTILAYMKVMMSEARAANVPLTKELFRKCGANVALFRGVTDWFSLINEYGCSKGVVVEHYINSSGLREIIEGTPIAHEFKKIYACSFFYDSDGIAEFPAVAIDFTTKTQFLFKINKGIESIADNKAVNEYVPENERPVPFRQMIYFGDGETDIPCMALMKQQGGNAIAVYHPESPQKRAYAEKLIADNRVNFVCPADFSENSEIFSVVTEIIDDIAEYLAFFDDEAYFFNTRLPARLSGLPVDLWLNDTRFEDVDDSKHLIIKFQKNKNKEWTFGDFIPMSIDDHPVILKKYPKNVEISDKEIEEIRQWVIANKENLIRLANMEIDIAEFLEVIKVKK